MIKFASLNEFENLWLTSDSHYAHTNICRGTSRWDLEEHGGHTSVRDFDTVEQMNDAIISGINKCVGVNDVLIHCGDVAFSGASKIVEFVSRITTNNIILCFGNHDHNIRGLGFQSLFENVLHTYDIQYVQYKGVNIVCSHYPMSVWHQAHKGVLHAFGHVHGNYSGLGKSMDVGIDSLFKRFGEYRPVNFTEFVEICNEREYVQLSHHNSKTS